MTLTFNLDFRPLTLDLKFAVLVNLVQVNVSTKLEVSMAFMFPEKNLRPRSDERGATLTPAP